MAPPRTRRGAPAGGPDRGPGRPSAGGGRPAHGRRDRAAAASAPAPAAPASARRVALDVLDRIDAEGAYANLVLPGALERAGLDARDRRFATELVYGTTRMRRACDFLVDRFLARPPEGRARNVLRLGAYQVAFAGVPPHAAVAETVGLAPKSLRGMVNAVLRRVADQPVTWPDDAVRLSVPDWVLDRLTADLGRERALAACEAMNAPAEVTERADGYVQDAASQQVAAAVGAGPGEVVVDLCAAPGGKATALAAAGAFVVAGDVRPGRARLVRANAERLAAAADRTFGADASPVGSVATLTADGTRPPLRTGVADHVLVDAPCSGLGTLRRRPDLRWRADPASVTRLAALQRALLAPAADLVRPGGTLTYSVCTLTTAESTEVDAWLADARPDLAPLRAPGGDWAPWGRGAILLPQAAGTDGMCLFRYRRADDR